MSRQGPSNERAAFRLLLFVSAAASIGATAWLTRDHDPEMRSAVDDPRMSAVRIHRGAEETALSVVGVEARREVLSGQTPAGSALEQKPGKVEPAPRSAENIVVFGHAGDGLFSPFSEEYLAVNLRELDSPSAVGDGMLLGTNPLDRAGRVLKTAIAIQMEFAGTATGGDVSREEALQMPPIRFIRNGRVYRFSKEEFPSWHRYLSLCAENADRAELPPDFEDAVRALRRDALETIEVTQESAR